MRKIGDINPTQVRILGALLEKEQATPDYYPPTLNALVAACNQKTNRDPVVRLEANEVSEELEALRQDVLVWRSDRGRVPHWSQSISRRLDLTIEEKAIMTVLMLRGPQTIGELRTRSQRLHPFASLTEVESALGRLATRERDLIVELPRQPGQKENRWMHRLLGDQESEPSRIAVAAGREEDAGMSARSTPSPSTADAPALTERIDGLEERVAALETTIQRLLDELGA